MHPHPSPNRSRLLVLAVAVALLGAFGFMQTGPLEASKQIPYLTSNSTSDAFTAITTARASTAPTTLFSMGDSTKRFRGVEATFFGAGSATNTFNYRVYAVERSTSVSTAGSPDDWDKQLLCHGTATLGASVGTARQWINSGNLIVDTLTCVVDAYGTAMCTAYGSPTPAAYSPGGGLEARLFLPECGNAEYLWIDFDMTGATSGNALLKRGI